MLNSSLRRSSSRSPPLARGERVELRGFGAFTVKQRNARIGRNPRTGVTVQVDDKTVPYFKVGTEMLRWLSGDGMKRRTWQRRKLNLASSEVFLDGPICPDCPRRTAGSRVSRLASCSGSGTPCNAAWRERQARVDGRSHIAGSHRRGMGTDPQPSVIA